LVRRDLSWAKIDDVHRDDHLADNRDESKPVDACLLVSWCRGVVVSSLRPLGWPIQTRRGVGSI
jgi:hypothetical protein